MNIACLLCLFFVINHVESQKEIFIAGLFPTLPNKANVPGFLLETGTKLALEHINNDSTILKEFTLKMIAADSKCDPRVSFKSLVSLLDNLPNKLVIYGAACSDATSTLADLTNLANIVQVSHTSTSITLSGSTYPSLYRAIPSDYPALVASLFLLKQFNWSRVAIIGEKTSSGLLRDSYNFLIEKLVAQKVTIIWKKLIDANEVKDSISEIKKKDARIILTIVSAKFGRQLLSEILSANAYGSSYVWIHLETYPELWWSHTNNTKNQMLKKVLHYSFGFKDNLNVHDQTTTTISGRTPQQIWSEYTQKLNMTNIPALASYSYDGVWFIAKALDSLVQQKQIKLEDIKTGNETFYKLLKETMKDVTFSGLTGEFKIVDQNTRERITGDVRIYQYDEDGKTVDVMSYDLSKNQANFITKKGSLWEEERNIPSDTKIFITKPHLNEEWVFILLTALCAVTIFVSLVFICYLWFRLVTRKDGGHSAVLNIFIAFGCICLCTAGVLFGLRVMDKLEDIGHVEKLCTAHSALVSVGITLVFGGTIAKLFGILRIVDGLNSKAFLCGTMFFPLMLFMAIDAVLLTLWLNENSPEVLKVFYEEDMIPNEEKALKTSVFCTQTQYPDWLIMIYIFHSVQAITSVFLAISTRGKYSKQIDDGMPTRISVLFIVFLLFGDIFSKFPSRSLVSSLWKSYVIFTSVVCGSTLIIVFILFPIKVCCLASCNKYSVETNNDIILTDVSGQTKSN